MTSPEPSEAERAAEKLTAAQRHWIADAWPISGPSGDHVVMDDEPDPLDPDIAHPVSGVLTPLGLAVRREILKQQEKKG